MFHKPWCVSVEYTTTPNKVLLVMAKGQLTIADKWINKTLPIFYTQHINDKFNITMLHYMTP